MKKTLTLFSVLLMSLALWSCSDDDSKDTLIEFYQLPQPAQQFISDYFDVSVTRIEAEGDHTGTRYEVWLANGFELEFDYLGSWTEVDAPAGRTIPGGIAPQPIISYMEVNYPNSGINEIRRTYRGYEIETISGMDLIFDLQGNFTGYNM